MCSRTAERPFDVAVASRRGAVCAETASGRRSHDADAITTSTLGVRRQQASSSHSIAHVGNLGVGDSAGFPELNTGP